MEAFKTYLCVKVECEITSYDNGLHDSLCSTSIVTDENIFDTWLLQRDLLKLHLHVHYVASRLDTECSKLMFQSPFPEDIPKSHLYNDWFTALDPLLPSAFVCSNTKERGLFSVCVFVCLRVCLELGIYLLKTERVGCMTSSLSMKF